MLLIFIHECSLHSAIFFKKIHFKSCSLVISDLYKINSENKTLKKSKFFIYKEIELLRDLVLKHQDVLSKKKSDSITVVTKQKIRRKIEVEINAQAVFTKVINNILLIIIFY